MLRSDGGRSSRPFEHDPKAYAVLAQSLGLRADELEAELIDRSSFVEALADLGVCDPPSVAMAIRDYPDLPERQELPA
jgi:hypothetical protein